MNTCPIQDKFWFCTFSPNFHLVGLFLLLILISSFFQGAHGQAAEEIYVDPVGGSDGAIGTEKSPLKTITNALGRVEPDGHYLIHLKPGSYSSESFPLNLPTSVLGLKIMGAVDGDVNIIMDSTSVPAFSFRPLVSTKLEEENINKKTIQYEFSNFDLSNGSRGISLVSNYSQDLQLTIKNCQFHNQKYQALELTAGKDSSLDVVIQGCTFVGSSLYAVDLGTREGSQLKIDVSGNQFTGVPSSMPFRNGIAIFLEKQSIVEGRVYRNRFENEGNAFLITTSNTSFPGGSLNLEITNNFVEGSIFNVSPGELPPENGMYLNFQKNHNVHIRLLHNTFVGGLGNALFLEQSGEDKLNDLCPSLSLEAIGNIFWNYQEGDFNFEDKMILESSECFHFQNNSLVSSALAGQQGNVLMQSSFFKDAENGNYRLAAESSLVDTHPIDDTNVESLLETVGHFDVEGQCRIVDGNADNNFAIDTGAFEFGTGVCMDSLMSFLRGDCALDDKHNITDAIKVFGYLFLNSSEPACLDACDANDDAKIQIADGIFILGFLFLDTAIFPEPFPEMGVDLTPDPYLCIE